VVEGGADNISLEHVHALKELRFRVWGSGFRVQGLGSRV